MQSMAFTNRWGLSSLTGVRAYGVRKFDKYRFSFVFTHILKFMRTIDFRTFSTQGLINEATLMISWLTFNLCDTIALTYLNPPRHTFTHLFTSTLIHTNPHQHSKTIHTNAEVNSFTSEQEPHANMLTAVSDCGDPTWGRSTCRVRPGIRWRRRRGA